MQKVLFPEPLFPKTFGGIAPLKQQSNPTFFDMAETAERQKTRRGSRRQGEPAAGYSLRPLKVRAGGKNNALFCGGVRHAKKGCCRALSSAVPAFLSFHIKKHAKWRCFAQPFRRKDLWKSVRGAQWAPFIMPLSFVNLLASFFPHQKTCEMVVLCTAVSP